MVSAARRRHWRRGTARRFSTGISAWMTLKKYTGRKFAYLFSSSVFAAYHVGMLIGMFRIGALLLLLLGLIAGGCIFNRLNELNDDIYPSWFVHMFANFAINTVGFLLFGVL